MSSPFLKIRTFIWGPPAPTSLERHLILKIDFFILTYVCLNYWINYLDRSNLSNAYVSGMRESLSFQSTQLNQINTIFYAGYCIGQIPNNLIMQRVPPGIWMPFTCLCWGLLTLGTGFTHYPWQIMVIRFFQGLLEASSFVGTHWILGSWYTEQELGKRTAIFTSSGLVGAMFSGFLQGGIYRSLNGRAGLEGWRWLFVVDFLITLPVAVYGYLCFPDTPRSTRARYLNAEERKLAVERLPVVKKERGMLGNGGGRSKGGAIMSLIRRILRSWQWWMFVLLWVFASNTEMYSSNAIMGLWLKAVGGYSVEQINYLPTTVSAFGIVCTLLLGWYSDSKPRSARRWHVGLILACTAITSGSIMLHLPTKAAKFFALILNGAQYAGQTVFFAWANDLTRADDAVRSVTVASMNTFSIAVYLWWSLIFYNVQQAPDWFAGSVAMVCMGVCTAIVTVATYILQRRQMRKDDSFHNRSSLDETVVGDDVGQSTNGAEISPNKT